MGGCAESERPDPATDASDFGMILRLWPAHHNDEQLRDDLIDALNKYSGTFNEVWFDQEFETLSMDKHRASAAKMAVASDMFREIGLTVSMQGICIGHGDSFEGGDDELRPTKWTTIVDAFGNRTQMSHCPRQEAFLDYMTEMYAAYAEVCQPRVVWIDDDLRVTHHTPARMLCFCDKCIADFNKQYGGEWTRENLVAAIDSSADGEWCVSSGLNSASKVLHWLPRLWRRAFIEYPPTLRSVFSRSISIANCWKVVIGTNRMLLLSVRRVRMLRRVRVMAFMMMIILLE